MQKFIQESLNKTTPDMLIFLNKNVDILIDKNTYSVSVTQPLK